MKYEVNVEVQKGSVRLEKNLTIDVVVSSNHIAIVLNDYHVHLC